MKDSAAILLTGKMLLSKDRSDIEVYQCARVLRAHNFQDNRGVQDAAVLLHPSDPTKIILVSEDELAAKFTLAEPKAENTKTTKE